MNLQYASLLVEGLFARKVIKTIQTEKYDEELFATILSQMEEVIDGIKANKNYENSDQNTLQILKTYGRAISVVNSLDVIKEEDCVGTYVKEIIKEITHVLESREVKIENMKKTIEYYEQIRNSSIDQGSRFNINLKTDDLWQKVTKF